MPGETIPIKILFAAFRHYFHLFEDIPGIFFVKKPLKCEKTQVSCGLLIATRDRLGRFILKEEAPHPDITERFTENLNQIPSAVIVKNVTKINYLKKRKNASFARFINCHEGSAGPFQLKF